VKLFHKLRFKRTELVVPV